MSVDLFGCHLRRIEASCGPQGTGYKFTVDGQYDIENKRLCNVAAPNDKNDAVNLITFKRIVQAEVQKVYQSTTHLRTELKNLDQIVDIHRDEVDDKLRKLEFGIATIRKSYL